MGKKKAKKQKAVDIQRTYMEDAHRPIVCLMFLLPVIFIYEIGIMLTAHGNLSAAFHERVIAFQLFYQFLMLLGISGFYLPGLAIIVILICWQIATGDSWRVNWRTTIGMAIESLMLAIPLLVLSHVAASYASRFVSLAAGATEIYMHWYEKLLLSIGAGLYEELLFRLVLITILSIVLIDIMRIPEGPAIFLIVISSAVIFSLYHYLGDEAFYWHTFVFRTIAGGYLAGIFILRGFGVTVGCHIMYDILVLINNAINR